MLLWTSVPSARPAWARVAIEAVAEAQGYLNSRGCSRRGRQAWLTGVFTVTLGNRMYYPAAARATPARRWKIHNSFGTRAGKFFGGRCFAGSKKGRPRPSDPPRVLGAAWALRQEAGSISLQAQLLLQHHGNRLSVLFLPPLP